MCISLLIANTHDNSMTSRNPNVHALESGTQNVTRAQLDHIDTEYESEQEPIPDLPLLTKRLRELVTEELGDPSVAINAKRRKLDSADESADMEDAPNGVHWTHTYVCIDN